MHVTANEGDMEFSFFCKTESTFDTKSTLWPVILVSSDPIFNLFYVW